MQSFHLEVEQLRQIFKCNNYPVGLIDQCVKTFLNRIYVPKRILIALPKKDVLIVLLFLVQFSLNLRSTILAIIFWDILMFDQIFVSPQVKQIVTVSNKHGIYELSHELPNDLRLKFGNIMKLSKTYRMITLCPFSLPK